MNILHVTNRYSGGVKTSLNNLVRSSPSARHYLVLVGDTQSNSHEQDEELFFSVHKIHSKNPLGVAFIIRALTEELNIDVIHAHSSWAGLYARILKNTAFIVYQPHGLAFGNPSFNPIKRFLFKFVEVMLSSRTSLYIAVGVNEERLIKGISGEARVILIRNWSGLPLGALREAKFQQGIVVGTAGRICVEKDPVYFAQVANELRKLSSNYRFVWVGAGDESLAKVLVDNEVEITGWQVESNVYKLMQEFDVFVSTSLFEGLPVALIDALKMRIPTFLRDIPPFRAEGLPCFKTPTELAQAIHEYTSSTKDCYRAKFDEFLFLTEESKTQKIYHRSLIDLMDKSLD